MKPNTTNAMYDLISQIKDMLSFEAIKSNVCSQSCSGCSLKLVEFLTTEIEQWEYQLAQGGVPNFNDINKLAKSAKKIKAILKKNNLI